MQQPLVPPPPQARSVPLWPAQPQQPARSGPFPPQPAATPAAAHDSDTSERRWVGGTVAVLALVAIGFIVLLVIAFK